MFFSIDRMASGRAVLMGEDGKPLEVGIDLLPPGAKAGDMLYYDKGRFTAAPEKTRERRERMADVLARLLRNREEPE
ncbi:MAG: DUF3006 domain-containing protein [Ruminococcaceae bacterium]|nr:DUF3006 domain-containing protein [Oscillospiraceae bacterium]